MLTIPIPSPGFFHLAGVDVNNRAIEQLAKNLSEANGGKKLHPAPHFKVRPPWEVYGSRVDVASSSCAAATNREPLQRREGGVEG